MEYNFVFSRQRIFLYRLLYLRGVIVGLCGGCVVVGLCVGCWWWGCVWFVGGGVVCGLLAV